MNLEFLQNWFEQLSGGPVTAKLALNRVPGIRLTSAAAADISLLVHPGAEDHVSRGIRKFGYWEGHETRLLVGNVNPGDVILDVGANIGYHTVLFGALAGPKGRVIAFEPAADNYCLLNRNIARNGLENVETMAAAVCDKAGVLGLRRHDESSGAHTLADVEQAGFSKTLLVPTLRLDDLPIDRVDFIKIDIQGAELLALDGASGLIEKNRSRLRMLLEYNVAIYVKAGARDQAIAHLERLRSAFSIQFCDPTIGDFYPLDMSSEEFIDMAAGGQRKLPDGRDWTSAVGYSDLWLTPRA